MINGSVLRLGLSSQHRHPADIPRHRHPRPFPAHRGEPAQQKLSEPHHRFDDAKHRLHSLFAQPLQRAPGADL